MTTSDGMAVVVCDLCFCVGVEEVGPEPLVVCVECAPIADVDPMALVREGEPYLSGGSCGMQRVAAVHGE